MSVPVAEALDDEEHRLLLALQSAIQAQRSPSAPSRVTARSADVLVCDNCGSPVAPADVAEAECRHCHHQVPVPSEVRTKARAVGAISEERKRLARGVARLLAQPGPHLTNAMVFLCWCSVIALVFGWVLADLARQTAAIRVLLVGVTVVLWALTSLTITSRVALRALALGCAARPPALQGGACECRRCGGPLPEPDAGGALACCIWCQADNILGLDPFANCQHIFGGSGQVYTALEERRAASNVPLLMALLGLTTSVFATLVLLTG